MLIMPYQAEMKHAWIIAIILLSISTVSAQAATWYVATSGSNSSSCGASGSPCATVNDILDNKAGAGDTIRVMPGSYTNQGTISLDHSTNHDNITLTASDTANRPQLLNSRIVIGDGVSGATVSYLRVRGGSSPNDGYWGVIEVSEYPTTIDHNEIWYGGEGVFIRTSQQVTVSNNEIHDLGLPNTDYDAMGVLIASWQKDPVPSGFSNAIRVTGNTIYNTGGDGLQENTYSEVGVQFNYLIIENNTIYNNQEQGLDFKGTDDVIIRGNNIFGNAYGGISNNSAYGSTARFEIHSNRIHDHENFAIFNQGGGLSWMVYNNIIYRNVTEPEYNYCAVHLPGDSGTVFYSNTLYNNTDTSGSRQTCGIVGGNGSGIRNNIFYSNGTGSNDRGNISSETNGTPSYNFVNPTSCGAGCITGNNLISMCYQSGNCPGFANLGNADFHLLPGSDVIDAGTSLPTQYAVDADGFLRPQGGGWDMGAYELGSGTPLISLQPPSNLEVVQ